MDAQGRADVSPKGDPQSAMLRLHEGAIWYADRPGNRRADGFQTHQFYINPCANHR